MWVTGSGEDCLVTAARDERKEESTANKGEARKKGPDPKRGAGRHTRSDVRRETRGGAGRQREKGGG